MRDTNTGIVFVKVHLHKFIQKEERCVLTAPVHEMGPNKKCIDKHRTMHSRGSTHPHTATMAVIDEAHPVAGNEALRKRHINVNLKLTKKLNKKATTREFTTEYYTHEQGGWEGEF